MRKIAQVVAFGHLEADKDVFIRNQMEPLSSVTAVAVWVFGYQTIATQPRLHNQPTPENGSVFYS